MAPAFGTFSGESEGKPRDAGSKLDALGPDDRPEFHERPGQTKILGNLFSLCDLYPQGLIGARRFRVSSERRATKSKRGGANVSRIGRIRSARGRRAAKRLFRPT